LNNYYLKSNTSKLHFIHSSIICRKKLWPFSRKHSLNLESLISILLAWYIVPLYKIHLLFNNFHIRALNGHFSMFNPHILASLVNTGTIMYCLNICIVAQDIMALHQSIPVASIQQLGSLHILNLVRFLKQLQSKVEN
jgi:hypothetical protein